MDVAIIRPPALSQVDPDNNNYLNYNFNGVEQRNKACHSEIRDAYTNNCTLIQWVKAKAARTKIEEAEQWASFLREAGLPCYVVGGAPAENNFGFRMDAENYLSGTHFWIGLTAMRYFCYDYATGFIHIPYWATHIYASMPALDAYQCLLLAHYAVWGPYWDEGHGMVYGRPFYLCSIENRQKHWQRLSVNRINNCNDHCTDYVQELRREDTSGLSELLQQNNFKEAYTFLTNKDLIK